MKNSKGDKRKVVSKIVQEIMETARVAREEGPASSVYRRETQMSNALTYAGTMLAKLDRTASGRKPSALQSLLGSMGSAPKAERRSWFFASAAKSSMPDAKRIEALLAEAAGEGRPLVLDQISADAPAANNDVVCVLPEGASDPVCEPR